MIVNETSAVVSDTPSCGFSYHHNWNTR